MFKIGTVILTPFPFTDLSSSKIRPAIILASQESGDDITLAYLSTQEHLVEKDYDIKISKNDKNGLKQDSYLRVTKLATLDKKVVLGELGNIDDDTLGEIKSKLRKYFNL